MTGERATRGAGVARAGLTGLIVAVIVGTAVGAASTAVDARPAAAAEATSSSVTLTNKTHALQPEGAPFPDLKVTVSQTRDLVSQGIRVSWTDGKKSEAPASSAGGANFLQIAQCWGEDPERPGHPDRRTCQYGGTADWGATRDNNVEPEHVAPQDVRYTTYGDGEYDETYTGIPFIGVYDTDAVNEETAPADRVVSSVDWDPVLKQGVRRTPIVDLNTNRFFSKFTTNEVKWAPSGTRGSGSVPFEVQTAMQSPGLGCGTPTTGTDGTVSGRSCWLVVIPRGEGDSGSSLINRSGLLWDAWEHHLAVKLDFKPLGVRCAIGAAERQLAGSELLSGAISSWQPQLCAGSTGAAFVHSIGSEADALLRAAGTSPSPLALASLPLSVERSGGTTDPLSYAPIALSGVSLSFSVDSQPNPVNSSPEISARRGLPLPEMKLTPRLVAKLLTASYREALPDGDRSHIGYHGWTDQGKNARTLVRDPDFWQHNGGEHGEWAQQTITDASVGDVLMPEGRSDLATQLWNYVLADAEARRWLEGKPDEWGMIVNPFYSINAEINPNGVALQLPRDNFPKADPIERPDERPVDPVNGVGPVNLVTWRPYISGFEDGAYHVLRGDGLILGEWDRNALPPKYAKSARMLFGSQAVLALSTTPAAARYQSVNAALRNPAGQFVVPSIDSLSAAAAAMSAVAGHDQVVGFDFGSDRAKAAGTAYPLAMPVYAALNPEQGDLDLRATYANLIRFAAQRGQTPGTDLGQLPPGYAPLPAGWVTQATAAADLIEHGRPAAAPPAPAPPSGPVTSVPGRPAPAGSSAPPPTPRAAGPAVAGDPAATGTAAGALAGGPTPADPKMGAIAAAVPAGLSAGIAAAAAVPLIGRLRRRA